MGRQINHPAPPKKIVVQRLQPFFLIVLAFLLLRYVLCRTAHTIFKANLI